MLTQEELDAAERDHEWVADFEAKNSQLETELEQEYDVVQKQFDIKRANVKSATLLVQNMTDRVQVLINHNNEVVQRERDRIKGLAGALQDEAFRVGPPPPA